MAPLRPSQLRAAAAIVAVRGTQVGMSHLGALAAALEDEANHRQKEMGHDGDVGEPDDQDHPG